MFDFIKPSCKSVRGFYCVKRLFVFLLFFLIISVSSFANNLDYNINSFILNPYPDIRQMLDSRVNKKYSGYTDIVNIAKQEIFSYYNKTTFDEPEWIRVKNFLLWLENNKESLSAYFPVYLFYHQNFKFFYELSYEKKKVFIGSFLGANYITKNITGKNFELQIVLDEFITSVYKEKGGIRIKADNMVPAINKAIHETTHILPVNDKSFIGKQITKKKNFMQYKMKIKEVY